MSDDLISRQAALDAIDKNRQDLLSLGMDGAEHILVHYGRRIIEELPTIDPIKEAFDKLLDEDTNGIALIDDQSGKRVDYFKVKHGRWITKSTNGEFFDCCSSCGYVEWDEPKNYCPNCGARMEGEENE